MDGIVKMRSLPQNQGIWKFYTMSFMTLAMSFNLMLLISILQRNILHTYFYKIDIHIMQGTTSRINGVTEWFILYGMLPLLINYLLIFRGQRYEKLINKYKLYNGKLFAWYTIGSLFLPIVLIYGVGLLWKLCIIK